MSVVIFGERESTFLKDLASCKDVHAPIDSLHTHTVISKWTLCFKKKEEEKKKKEEEDMKLGNGGDGIGRKWRGEIRCAFGQSTLCAYMKS